MMPRNEQVGTMIGSTSSAARTARCAIIAAFLLAGTMAQGLPTQAGEDHGEADPPGLTVGKLLERVAKLDRAVKELEADEAMPPARRAERRHSLASGYRDLGQSGKAVHLLEEVCTHHLASFGREHLDTLQAMRDLAIAYEATGRKAEAKALREEWLEPSRPAPATTLAEMKFNCCRPRDPAETLELREEILSLYRKVLGPEHAETHHAMTRLAIAYRAAERYAEAIALEKKALALKREHTPHAEKGIIESLENLATCYEKADRKEEAKPLRDEIAKLKADAAE